MATRVGSLFVDLRASTAQLGKDIAKAGPVMRRQFNTSVKRAFIGGSVAVAGIAAATAKASARIDELTKTADKMSMPVDRLRIFQDMADKAGISMGTLSTAFRDSQRRISEAAQGTGEAVGALRELNLSAKDLNSLSPDEQFMRVAESLEEIENAGDRARIAYDIFGRSGQEVLNLLRSAPGAIDATTQKLDSLGVTLSRVDAAKVEIANDALSDMRLVSEGVTNQLSVAMAPVIKGVADKLLEAAGSTGGFREQILRLVEVGVKGFAFIGNAMKGWQVVIKAGEIGFLGLGEVVLRAMQHISTSIDGVVNFALDKVNMLIRAYNSLPEIMRGDAIGELQTGVSGRTSGLAGVADSFSQARQQAQGELVGIMSEPLPTTAIDTWLAEVRAKTEETATAIAETVTVAKEVINETPILNDETIEDTTTKVASLGQSVQVNLLDPVRQGFQSIGAQLKGLVAGTVSWAQAASNVAMTFVGAVIDGIVQVAAAWLTQQMIVWTGMQALQAGGMKAAAAAAVSAGGTALAVWQPAAIAASIATLGAAAGVGAAAYTGAMMIGTAVGVAAGAIGALASSFINPVASAAGASMAPGRAMGGHVNAGDLYRVNERGTEFFSPHTSGEVIPMGKMDRFLDRDSTGGPIIQLTQNFQGGVTSADLGRAADVIVARTKEAVAEAIGRGGSYRRRVHA